MLNTTTCARASLLGITPAGKHYAFLLCGGLCAPEEIPANDREATRNAILLALFHTRFTETDSLVQEVSRDLSENALMWAYEKLMGQSSEPLPADIGVCVCPRLGAICPDQRAQVVAIALTGATIALAAGKEASGTITLGKRHFYYELKGESIVVHMCQRRRGKGSAQAAVK